MDKLKEYEIATERVRSMSEQRQAASQLYLAVNTGIVGVFAFLVKDGGFSGWGSAAVGLPLFAVGIAACLVWHRIITDFRQIIGWHYEQLRDLEKSMPDCQGICTNEWEKFFKPQGGRERFGFSRLEVWLPRLFIGLYAVLFVGLLITQVGG